MIGREGNTGGENRNSKFSNAEPKLQMFLDAKSGKVQQKDNNTAVKNIYHNPTLVEVQRRVIRELNPDLIQNITDEATLSKYVEMFVQDVCNKSFPTVTNRERSMVLQSLMDEFTGFGPLQDLIIDKNVSEIMVNGHDKIFYEKNGKLELSDFKFRDNEHVMQIIYKIITPLGRRIDESSPMVDARLPDGSRVNVVIPPISLVGPTLTIRKFFSEPLTARNLVAYNTLNDSMAKFLQTAILAKANIIVAGGTGSGKTTLLNVLSGFIPKDERIVTIEDAAELKLNQPHIISLEARPANIEGKGEITIRDLVRNSLRMRPDRIIIGEVRGAEALDMLQAMNTGHNGSLSTIHANSARDALARLETMVLFTGIDFPIKAIREQISSAIDLIVYIERMPDGSRKVTNITEVLSMEGDTLVTQDIFYFEKLGKRNGKLFGEFRENSIRPRIIDKFRALGLGSGW